MLGVSLEYEGLLPFLQILAAVEGAAQAVHNLSPPRSNAASPLGPPAGSTSSSNELPAISDEAHPGAAASPYAREGAVYPQSGESSIAYLQHYGYCLATAPHMPCLAQGLPIHCTNLCVPTT